MFCGMLHNPAHFANFEPIRTLAYIMRSLLVISHCHLLQIKELQYAMCEAQQVDGMVSEENCAE